MPSESHMHPEPHHPSHLLRYLLVIVVVIIMAALIIGAVSIARAALNSTPSTQKTQIQTPTHDSVKSSGGANGDTTPSGTGTGPGSNNSLLGQ